MFLIILCICIFIFINLFVFLNFIAILFLPFNKFGNNNYDEWSILETKIVSKLKHGYFERKFIDININIDSYFYNTKLTYIQKKNNCKSCKNILFIHGTGGSSLSFMELESYIPADYNFYALDLPGAGKSTSSIGKYNNDSNKFIDFYIECIYNFQQIVGLDKVIIIGHSFGAYISVNYCYKYSNLVESLILFNPALLFPTLGSFGPYYGIFFKLMAPYSFFRFTSKLLILQLLDLFKINDKAYYYLNLYSNKDNFIDKTISSLITINKNGVICNKPILDKLLQIRCSIKFIYGENDDLTPYHQGQFICNIRNTPEFLYIIPKYGHIPFEGITKEIIIALLDSKQSLKVKYYKLSNSCDLSQYISTFNPDYTDKVINKLYQDIQSNLIEL